MFAVILAWIGSMIKSINSKDLLLPFEST